MWEERSTECLHAPWAHPLSLPPAPHWEPARWELLSSQEWSCGAPCDAGNQRGSGLEGEKQQQCLPLCFHTSEEFILSNYELKMKILVSLSPSRNNRKRITVHIVSCSWPALWVLHKTLSIWRGVEGATNKNANQKASDARSFPFRISHRLGSVYELPVHCTEWDTNIWFILQTPGSWHASPSSKRRNREQRDSIVCLDHKATKQWIQNRNPSLTPNSRHALSHYKLSLPPAARGSKYAV